MRDVPPEWSMLEDVCRIRLGILASDVLEGHLKCPTLQWGEAIDHALRHKMLPRLAASILDAGYARSVPPYIRAHLENVRALNVYRNSYLQEEVRRVASALFAASISATPIKGAVLDTLIYGRDGGRYFRDLDFLCKDSSEPEIDIAMAALGYEQGSYSSRTKTVIPHSRKTLLHFALNKDHIPEYTRVTGDRFIPHVVVEFATSFTWNRSDFCYPIEPALARVFSVGADDAPGRLDRADNLIYTMLHLFREAWLYRWLQNGNDVNLSKFLDVGLLFQSVSQAGELAIFRDRIVTNGLTKPALWVLTHLDDVFGTRTVSCLDLEEAATNEWLQSAQPTLSGKARSWRGSMSERLRSRNRPALFES